MLELRTYEVSARPIQPDSKLPEVDPLKIEATDETAAITEFRQLSGIDGSGHRYEFTATDTDTDPERRARALAASCLRSAPPVVGYGFSPK